MNTEIINTVLIGTRAVHIKPTVTRKSLHLLSYKDKKHRSIFLGKTISKGTFNSIHSFSDKKGGTAEDKLIIRLSKNDANVETELNGIELQYRLSLHSQHIGTVVDYGRLISATDQTRDEYSILEKYGKSLKDILESKHIFFKNMHTVVTFMHELLQTIKTIHDNEYAHLDLKPSNILFKNIFNKTRKTIDYIDFSIIDFGASKKFTIDASIFIKEQMASHAFSPPELKKRLYGKKSDIWAYGVICYLVIINKFYFTANAHLIFLHSNINKIREHIVAHIDSIENNMYLRKKHSIETFMEPLNSDYKLYLLKDFLKSIFIIDINERPTATTLLDHTLFSLIK
tara:strand:- start:7343 stop:8368 length:1026 start_codon:yes stop_codon:yes gene_type:complete